ncbi:MAG: (Fe-S)-binding protein, partial [Thermodesulfobacteriota bacterium]
KFQAKRVVEVFERLNVDFITTACASCGIALKHHLTELLEDEDEETRNKAKALGKKVRDITELLVNELGYSKTIHDPRSTIHNKIVTYHDPCHLCRSQKINEEPRSLIETAGARLKEMSDPSRCCGLGGTFSLENYELSMEINREKTEAIKETGADIVVTACPGCIIHLRDGLHRAGFDTEVRHVVELLT